MPSSDPVARLWARVDTSGEPGACWPWQGRQTRPGRHSRGSRAPYGLLKIGGRNVRTHRFAFVASGGTLAEGEVVRHSCNNSLCCNPAHLKAGTHKENADDREHAGRAPRTHAGRFVALKHTQTRQTATIDTHAHDGG